LTEFSVAGLGISGTSDVDGFRGGPMLSTLHHAKSFRRCRETSYDRRGGGRDFVRIEAGQSHHIPTLRGPGIVRHIWLTLGHFYYPGAYQNTRMVIVFDGA
jgi:hypothetical protein